MGGAHLSSVLAHGCRAFRQMFVEWPRRHRFVGKIALGCYSRSWRPRRRGSSRDRKGLGCGFGSRSWTLRRGPGESTNPPWPIRRDPRWEFRDASLCRRMCCYGGINNSPTHCFAWYYRVRKIGTRTGSS